MNGAGSKTRRVVASDRNVFCPDAAIAVASTHAVPSAHIRAIQALCGQRKLRSKSFQYGNAIKKPSNYPNYPKLPFGDEIYHHFLVASCTVVSGIVYF